MSASQTPSSTTTPSDREERRRRRGVYLKFGVAGLAVIGVGAALTTAAWTDQVFFAADAKAAAFDLQGSRYEDSGWGEYNTEDGALVIPISASRFGNLVPSEKPVAVQVYVRNNGSVDTHLKATTAKTGELFGTDSPVKVTTALDTSVLAKGESTAVTISLTPGAMPDTLQGKSGTILVTVTGSTE